jgi:hypothetical protein
MTRVIPYRPSWVDWLIDKVDRLPGPSWIYYILAGVIVVLPGFLIQADAGHPLVFSGFMLHAALASANFALIHYLDLRAASAFEVIKPALKAEGEKADDLYYRLTTLPAGPTILASICGVLTILVLISFFPLMSLIETLNMPLVRDSMIYVVVTSILTWWVAGALVFHTVHQLRMVNWIYLMHIKVDLFQLSPLFALSGVSARTGIGFNLITALMALVGGPAFYLAPVALISTLGAFAVIGVVTFALPLLGVHRLMVDEKERLQDETGQRLEIALKELDKLMDRWDMGDMDAMNKLINSLETRQNIIERISTWPWRPDTLRTVVSLFFAPILLILIQLILQQVF